MKYLFPLLLVFFLVSCEKEVFNPNQIETFTLQSAATDTSYTIEVALPAQYDPSNTTYATVYVLDGDQNFDFVANQCETLSNQYGKQNVIVVSIGYGHDRSFDYTPTEVGGMGGGAENFMHFIKNELIPAMEARYAVDTLRKNRVILGHSYGGLLAAYAFTNFNEVFGAYLMLSPSIWYDHEVLLQYEQDKRAQNAEVDQFVFMGLGGLESSGRMMAPFEAFYQRLAHHYPSIQLTLNIEPHLEHMGSKNPNIEKGLACFFQQQ